MTPTQDHRPQPACPHTWNEGDKAFGCVLPLGHEGDHTPFQFASGMYKRPAAHTPEALAAAKSMIGDQQIYLYGPMPGWFNASEMAELIDRSFPGYGEMKEALKHICMSNSHKRGAMETPNENCPHCVAEAALKKAGV